MVCNDWYTVSGRGFGRKIVCSDIDHNIRLIQKPIYLQELKSQRKTITRFDLMTVRFSQTNVVVIIMKNMKFNYAFMMMPIFYL